MSKVNLILELFHNFLFHKFSTCVGSFGALSDNLQCQQASALLEGCTDYVFRSR